MQRAVIGTLAMGAALVGVTDARAATIIGSDLSLPAATPLSASFTTVHETQRTGGTTPLAAPSTGVVVAIRLKHGANDANARDYGFRILTGMGNFLVGRPATPTGADPRFEIAANAPAGIATYAPTDDNGRPRGIPIAAGERVGLLAAEAILGAANVTGGGVVSYTMNDGLGGRTYLTQVNTHPLFQAVIEPDADNDTYGDESQDPCPTAAGLVCGERIVEVPVPVPGPTVTVPGPTVVQTVACAVGTRPTGAQCVKITCSTGKKLDGNRCVKIKCRTGRKLRGSKCVKIKCKKPRRLKGNRCVKPRRPSARRS